MSKLQELNIIMLAPRGVGKTSLLAAMHEEFDKTFESAGLTTWVSDSQTLDAIEECKRLLQNMDYRLQKLAEPTVPKLNPWEDEGFVFEVGNGGKKFMKIRFTDPSGEYFKPTATPDQKKYVKEQLTLCDAVIIPIDATALMEKKTGRTRNAEIGSWHVEKNDPERITKLLKDAYESLTKPRLVILAPLKCESYMKTDEDANDLVDHIKIGYRKLLDFLKEDALYDKLAVVIAPVQTIGHITFSHAETDNNSFTKFFYNKVPIDAPYAPKDGDQPLRYVLRFLLNVYNQVLNSQLKKARKNLSELEEQVGVKADQLDSARRKVNVAEQRVNQRKRWGPFKFIADLFDDVDTKHSQAKKSCAEKENVLKKTENQKSQIESTVDATEDQIEAFNTVISKFANDCKQERGFAILQGRARLNIPK
ncbi:hypothetical protein NIES267_75410 (plasmid) [Calothrix parasitica NIES-267]|uniref:Double-GTPase 2 domain-containing protein n=1 Tax=Calothrix parasitica NIES-267 TaxID=1973488 RepID=A0A1Z4M3E4_9CYAN|nr:hypothetical protein NIES267_75410 [Calothrix parasitica NIES-267]